MSEFQKGQLVVVWGGSFANRRIRIFCGYSRSAVDGITYYLCREATDPEKDAVAWHHCASLEEIEPRVFLGADREVIDSLQKERDRQQKQIRWLSEQLDQINRGRDEMCDCPDPELRFSMRPMDCDPEGCAHCWEKASLKAVKEDADGAE